MMCLLVFAHVIACAFVMVGTDPTGFPNRESWIVKTNPETFDISLVITVHQRLAYRGVMIFGSFRAFGFRKNKKENECHVRY